MRRLFWKFFAIIWLTVAASIGGVIALALALQASPFSEELARQQQTFTLDVAEELIRREGKEAAEAFVRTVASSPQATTLSISTIPAKSACPERSAAHWRQRTIRSVCYHLAVAGTSPGILKTGWVKLTPWLAALCGSALAAFWLAQYLVAPVAYLRQGLSALAHGQFDMRIGDKVDGRKDEVTALAHDFDTTAARLEELQDSQQRLFHDVSHELRSPLSRMRATLGVLRQSPPKLELMMERMDGEIERLDHLISEILTLARLTTRTEGELTVQTIDIMDLLSEILNDAAFEGEIRGITLQSNYPGPFVAEVNGELIYRAIENVVRNAVKYTSNNSDILVDCTISTDVLQIQITDEGEGVPAQHLENIFKPFVRDKSSTRLGGHGLGLAIARQALERHGGCVSAAIAQNGGLTVCLEIPRDLNREGFDFEAKAR